MYKHCIFFKEDVDSKYVQEHDDDFEKLRQAREKEKRERHQQKIVRSISTQPASTPIDTDLLHLGPDTHPLQQQMGSGTEISSNRSSLFIDPNL